MPIDCRLSTEDWDTTIVFFNDTNPQQFTLTLPHRPTRVELDPDNWILRDIAPDNPVPMTFRLHHNFPNPFNGSTVIEYEVPRATFVTINVFNLLGQHVGNLVNETIYPGLHRVIFNAAGLPSGVYCYRLQAGATYLTRKALILR